MVERNAYGQFGSMVVFPGGRVDTHDVPAGAVASDDRSHRNAALRELAEEAGILLTTRGSIPAPPARGAGFWREVRAERLQPATEDLTLVSRWVTPEGMARRFDTRFYLAVCHGEVEVRIDAHELIGYRWIRPDVALHRHESGEMNMILPTLAHLRWLSRRSSVAEALASADGADGRTLISPRVLEDGSIVPIPMPAEPR